MVFTMQNYCYSILTYIFGDYELLREPEICDPNAEYVLVTDNATLKSKKWKVVIDERLNGLVPFDKCLYVRYHPFEYVSSDICVKIDGSIQIKNQLSPIINKFVEKKADLSLLINPVHCCLVSDYAQWVNTRNYPNYQAEKALKKLKDLGLRDDYKGYYQANFIIEKKNEITKAINDKTFYLLEELKYDGHLDRFDQPIWSFVINTYFSDKVSVMAVDEHIVTFSKYLQWCWHNSCRPIPFKVEMKPTYLFDKPVACEHFDYLGELSNDDEKFKFLMSELLAQKEKNNHQEEIITIQSAQLSFYYIIKNKIWKLVSFLLIFILCFICIYVIIYESPY